MEVSIIENGEVIWMRNASTQANISSCSYLKDGTQQRIIAALVDALEQANGQLQLTKNVN
ncbi:Rrf2 family transcriptional regulator [Kosakonia sp. ML.JS2a]|uniref:Rrf2 family transcriptional regulator n=1 Tax=Kosakonia sp. ML.JS2a TaxID=2980557 RepID=UPI0021D925CB|nr:Rrf2 family transcriptional regulator [Kosakonia sp. ML.JS2a]UXY08970.1 Rrf2 family transcriptional regulator [Kosakonia sp. ML.JS2a]